jgi:hypothetical protein
MGIFSSIFGTDKAPGDGEVTPRDIDPVIRTRRVHNPAWPVDRYGPTDPDMAEYAEPGTPPWWRR